MQSSALSVLNRSMVKAGVSADLERAKPSLRRAFSAFIQKHRWLPAVSTLASVLALIVVVRSDLGLFLALGAAMVILLASYIWGYSARAFRQGRWPPLNHLKRRQYAQVWDSLATSTESAAAAATGQQDEDGLRRSAAECVQRLVELLPVGVQDEILEIGCGLGRIGLELAAHCRQWTGADTSANMLAYASERLREKTNIRLVQLQNFGLPEFANESFDAVYATNMLAHLDEMDRWRYVEEAFRVLRPGGRIYIDNIDLESEAGWSGFIKDAECYQLVERPPYMPRFSTASELMTYVTRAGFDQIRSHRRSPLIILTAVKPLFDKPSP